MTFYVTFGQKSPFRNGWVEVEAKDYQSARDIINYAIGPWYSNIFNTAEFDGAIKSFLSRGKLGETLK